MTYTHLLSAAIGAFTLYLIMYYRNKAVTAERNRHESKIADLESSLTYANARLQKNREDAMYQQGYSDCEKDAQDAKTSGEFGRRVVQDGGAVIGIGPHFEGRRRNGG